MNQGNRVQAGVMMSGRPQQFNVTIKGMPTDANSDASKKPHSTRLELHCSGVSQTMINNNYPVTRTFTWATEGCGDAILQIEVGDVVLTKHYPGQDGFPDFLKDMGNGRKTFSAGEFPGEKRGLDNLGVRSIMVNYQITGGNAVIEHTSTLAGEAPRMITKCWRK
jgi:type VI secretion system protein ImpL